MIPDDVSQNVSKKNELIFYIKTLKLVKLHKKILIKASFHLKAAKHYFIHP